MNTHSISPLLVGIYCDNPTYTALSRRLAEQWQKPIIKTLPKHLENDQFVLCMNELGVILQATGKKAAGATWVDFVSGASAHRRQFGGGKGQMIAKAVGVKGQFRPNILDVTAGLGEDGFVLATLGCHVHFVERSPIVHALLSDGVERAQLVLDPELQDIIHRIRLTHDDSLHYLNVLEDKVDVIYLDPMFPERKTKAEVNKNMKAFHTLVGGDEDSGVLLAVALDKAEYRVVVKRPRKAPTLGEQYVDAKLPQPSVCFEGKSTRFDVYTLKKMPT